MGLLNSMVNLIWAQHIFSRSIFFFFQIGIELSIKINNTNNIIEQGIVNISKSHNDFFLLTSFYEQKYSN